MVVANPFQVARFIAFVQTLTAASVAMRRASSDELRWHAVHATTCQVTAVSVIATGRHRMERRGCRKDGV